MAEDNTFERKNVLVTGEVEMLMNKNQMGINYMEHLISGNKYYILLFNVFSKMWFAWEFNTMLVDTNTFIISIMLYFFLCLTHKKRQVHSCIEQISFSLSQQ